MKISATTVSFLILFFSLGTIAAKSPSPIPAVDRSKVFRVELDATSPIGEASIREHSIVWHPLKEKYYLIADVVPLDSPHHPNTYETELHLWSSSDLEDWKYHGAAVEKGSSGNSYDGHGVASPVGMAFLGGLLLVPFSARRTSRFEERGIGLAISEDDPEDLPWTKTDRPISDLPGEDDDPALLAIPGDDSLHLYHRRTGPGGYRIVHSQSSTPENPGSWRGAEPVTSRPPEVRAQELTGAFYADGKVHLLIMEHLLAGGMKIAHLISEDTDGTFTQADPVQRFLLRGFGPGSVAYSGHITPVVRDGELVAFFWTVVQKGKRYGLQGHPVLLERDEQGIDR